MSDREASPESGPESDEVVVVVEKTFEVNATCGQAWDKLLDLTAAHDLGAHMWWLPGFECPGIEVAAVPGERLEVSKAQPPCQGSTIEFTLEGCGDAARIHVAQSGFDPAFVEMAGEDFWAHGRFLLDAVERFFLGTAADTTH